LDVNTLKNLIITFLFLQSSKQKYFLLLNFHGDFLGKKKSQSKEKSKTLFSDIYFKKKLPEKNKGLNNKFSSFR